MYASTSGRSKGASAPRVTAAMQQHSAPSIVWTAQADHRRPRMPARLLDQSERRPPAERATRFIRP